MSPVLLPRARGADPPAHSDGLQADTLADGTKHWQKCERTASMKQMGAKCGNKERKKKPNDKLLRLKAPKGTAKRTTTGDTEG